MRVDEDRRDLMSKQLAIVGEVQQLGSAMHSHPLNTASQRYALLKRTRTEHTHVRQQLELLEVANRRQLEWYATEGRRIAVTGGGAAAVAQAVGSVLVPPAEFVCVRELLENSAQGAMYAQCEQLLLELDASYKQQATVAQQCVRLHEQYVQAIEMQPIEPLLAAHRWHRYAEWCTYLMAQPTVVACRDVIAQFQCVFGGDAAPAPAVVHHLGHLTVQLHTAWCTATACLHALTERRQAIDESDVVPCAGDFPDERVECVRIQMLCGFNRRMLTVEGAARAAGSHLTDARTGENGGDDLLIDELALWTSLAERMVQHGSHTPPAENIHIAADCVHASAALYAALQELRHVLVDELLTNTMTGIFTENVDLLAAIAQTSGLQTGIAPIDELLATLHELLQRIRSGDAPEAYDRSVVQRMRDHLDELTGRLFGSCLVRLSFRSVLAAQRVLGECVAKLQVPHEWRGIDELANAGDLQVSFVLRSRLGL